jgi:anaerobic selenocysteine-containing dehydrogenase
LTACPLDCYDACSLHYENGKIKASHDEYTQGFLCPHLNHYEEFSRIQVPRFKGENISMQEALSHLLEMLKEDKKILHYRGRGNFALMQSVTDQFFSSYGAVLCDGSLCDGAGEAGVIAGRGHNEIMTQEQIAKSEVIIFWGRNPHTTSSHILPLLKGKTVIVIDPLKTQIASSADLFIQIKPHGDLELALLMSRFLCIEDGIDRKFLQEHAPEYEDFYELTQSVRIKAVLDKIGVTLGDIGKILQIVRGKKVAILCGVGVQKYLNGSDVVRAIDAFGALLGLFGKEGCGMSYMGDSMRGIKSPFLTCKPKKISRVDTKFGDFDTVFIQGANPLNQMPDTQRVLNEIEKVENLIYFGLYENQTSQAADLVIPAKNFLEKDDIRSSYASQFLYEMPKMKESEIGISEYELTSFLCEQFGILLQSEQEYLSHFRSFAQMDENNRLKINNREEIAYEKGFSTDDEEFVFLDELDIGSEESELFYLITCKSTQSLNSQFKVKKNVYLHPSLGFEDGELVRISSNSGELTLHVSHDERLREDCVLIYSGTNGVNRLTSSKKTYEGNSAAFQQNRVSIERVNC